MKEKNRAWKILLNILICTIGALTVFSAGILFSKNKLVMNDTGIEAYYGVYEIKEFYPDAKTWGNVYGEDLLPSEEVDLFLGQKIVISDTYYIAYDNYRYHGDYRFDNDYYIQKYVIENPVYTITESNDINVKIKEYTNLLDDVLETLLQKPYKKIQISPSVFLGDSENAEVFPTLYVIDKDRLLWCMGLSYQCFIIEKISEVDETIIDNLKIEEKNVSIDSSFWGTYHISKFCPTKYWKDRVSRSDLGSCLTEEDVTYLMGKQVTLQKDFYQGYGYAGLAQSSADEKTSQAVYDAIKDNPEYIAKYKDKSELYGLKNSNLPKQFVQTGYIEIRINIEPEDPIYLEHPYDGTNAVFYQIDSDKDKLLMLYMKELFILERGSMF